MACRIICNSAGKDADSFIEGAKRFEGRHPSLDWTIEAGQLAEQLLHITITLPDGGMRGVDVVPTSNVADSVSQALERFLRVNP